MDGERRIVYRRQRNRHYNITVIATVSVHSLSVYCIIQIVYDSSAAFVVVVAASKKRDICILYRRRACAMYVKVIASATQLKRRNDVKKYGCGVNIISAEPTLMVVSVQHLL